MPRTPMRCFLASLLLLAASARPCIAQNPLDVQVQASREIAALHIKETNFSTVTTAQTVAFLRGLMFASPEHVDALLRDNGVAQQLRSPSMTACARNLGAFSQSLSSQSPVDGRRLDEMCARHGLTGCSQRSYKEHQDFVYVVRDVAEVARLTEAYVNGRQDDSDSQAILKQKREINHIARSGMASVLSGDNPGLALLAGRQTWHKQVRLLAEQAYIVSSVMCR